MYYRIQMLKPNMRLEYLIINVHKECPRGTYNLKIMREIKQRTSAVFLGIRGLKHVLFQTKLLSTDKRHESWLL